METFSCCNCVEIESTIENILLLYAADSMAILDKSFHQNINWSGMIPKAVYKLSRNLEELFEDINFDLPYKNNNLKWT